MSQYTKGRNPARTLGHPRASVPLPPVHTGKGEPSFAEGMIVSSMAVPPQKSANGALRKPNEKTKSPDASSRRPSEDWEKIIKEKERIIREKEKDLREKSGTIRTKEQEIISLNSETGNLKERIVKLEHECKQLKDTIHTRETDIKRLQAIIDSKNDETDYKPLYEAEKSDHEATKNSLAMTDAKLKATERILMDVEAKHATDMASMKKELEDKLAAVVKEKDEQLKEKDERIQKMKKQMAEAFTGNSMERQQQIDELTKELTKVQAECDSLRMRLRNTGGGSKNASCENCRNLTAHLEKKEQTIKEKNRTIDELNLVISKYEVQLKQQEELIKQWQDVKGRVLIFEK